MCYSAVGGEIGGVSMTVTQFICAGCTVLIRVACVSLLYVFLNQGIVFILWSCIYGECVLLSAPCNCRTHTGRNRGLVLPNPILSLHISGPMFINPA